MSHTNSTTNYSLPQFVGTDKPAWLTDINGAFSTIDTNLKTVSDNATTAGTNATTANTNIGTLSNLTTVNKTNLVSAINENTTNIGTVSGVASQASSNATSAKTTADGLATYFDINNFGTPTTTTSGVTIETNRLRYASNADGSLGKIYGDLLGVKTTNSAGGTISIATPFRPSSTITIEGAFIQQHANTQNIFKGDITIAPDGTLTIARNSATYNMTYTIIFPACLYFFKDFGDTGNE